MIRKLLALTGLSVAACWFLGRGTRGCRPVNAIVGAVSQDVHTAIDEITSDVQAVQERDPAATSKLEIITSYAGLHALWLHRLAHKLHDVGVPLAAALDQPVQPLRSPASRSTPARRSATGCSSTTARASSSARPPRSATT